MNDIIRLDSSRDPQDVSQALPAPREDVSIRPAVLGDYAFIDALQKQHSKAVGFMWEAAIKGHIEKGHVLVAECMGGAGVSPTDRVQADEISTHGYAVMAGETPAPPQGTQGTTGGTPIPTQGSSLNPNPQNPTPVGYLIAVDRYLKRDELGIIYQMNIAPGSQRGLIGANLLKAQFDRSAYGCRLYCCWCAQDLAANKFWEAMGFVPLAFRTGGGRRKKDGPRMHIFWQKRIRQGDTGDPASGGTPYWFPSQTGAGAIGEDRLVLPIPPGTHWSDAKPIVLPNGPSTGEEVKLLEAEVDRLTKAKKGLKKKGPRGQGQGGSEKAKAKAVQSVKRGGLHFSVPVPPEGDRAANEAKQKADAAAAIDADLKTAKKAARKAKKKFDPAQEAFARELKDRWLEEVAARPGLLAAANAKYDVTRQIEATTAREDEAGEECLRLGEAA